LKRQGKLSSTFVPPYITATSSDTVTLIQAKAVSQTVDGTELDYDNLIILTLVEEDGELKVDDVKDFSDPEKRSRVHGWVAKALAKKAG
jgi:hypothetical protein